jgi:hypothetical protein
MDTLKSRSKKTMEARRKPKNEENFIQETRHEKGFWFDPDDANTPTKKVQAVFYLNNKIDTYKLDVIDGDRCASRQAYP